MSAFTLSSVMLLTFVGSAHAAQIAHAPQGNSIQVGQQRVPSTLLPPHATLLARFGSSSMYDVEATISDVDGFYRELAEDKKIRILSDAIVRQPPHSSPFLPTRSLKIQIGKEKYAALLFQLPNRIHLKIFRLAT